MRYPATFAFGGTTAGVMACVGTAGLIAASLALFKETTPRGTELEKESAQGRVVDNPAPDWSAPAFRLSAPVVRAGGRQDTALQNELWSVPDAAMTAAGQLVVIMRSGAEVRVFDQAGSFVRSIGGVGQAPGEFESVRQLRVLTGDTLVMYDQSRRRLMVYTPQGGPVRSTEIRATATSARNGIGALICCFGDGAALFRRGLPWTSRDSTVRPRLQWLIAPTGQRQVEGTPVLTTEGDDPSVRVGPFRWKMNPEMDVFPPVPFSRVLSIAISGEDIAYGMGDTYEFHVVSRSGTLRRTVRAATAPAPVTPADARAARARFAARTPATCRALGCTPTEAAVVGDLYATRARTMVLPATWPAYSEIRGDEEGSVWVRRYTLPGEQLQWWAKFDGAGVLQGTVQLPQNHTVLRFTRGHVLLKQNEPVDGFAFVSAHRIEPVR